MIGVSAQADDSARVAIVTGGASGIGAAVVERLEADGLTVAVLDLVADASPHKYTADVADDRSVRSAVAAVIADLGRLDVLVNNAGIGAQGTVSDNADDEWQRVLDVNVVGMARVTRAALPHLRSSPAPAIVNLGSVVATVGFPGRVLYSASKGAVLSATRAMAADLIAEGIRVNAVSPGTVDTPWVDRLVSAAGDAADARRALAARQPHGRLVLAQEIADAVAYLVDHRSGSTNGIVLTIDGGLEAIRLPSPAAPRAIGITPDGASL